MSEPLDFSGSAPTRPDHRPGDVFQIVEAHGRAGWVGCLVMATEIKGWGLQGFVAWPQAHDRPARAFVRLTWAEVEYVGRAPLTPAPSGGTNFTPPGC